MEVKWTGVRARGTKQEGCGRGCDYQATQEARDPTLHRLQPARGEIRWQQLRLKGTPVPTGGGRAAHASAQGRFANTGDESLIGLADVYGVAIARVAAA